VHVNAVQGVLRQITAGLPAMLNSMLTAREQNSQREETFWKAWPQLDKVQHREAVQRAALLYRQLNPNATSEELVKAVGAQVVVAYNLLQAPTTSSPQAPVVNPAVRTPFTPAGPMQTSAPAAPVNSGGWDVIAQAMQED